ncbi:MAG: outer membrane beta-barrel protein [Thermodesulfobacteriota bacterium]
MRLNRLNRLNRLILVIILLWMIGLPAMVHAEVGDLLAYAQPYISVREEYNSNINLTPTNRTEDYITTVSPGLRFSTLPRAEGTRGEQAPSAERRFGIDFDFNAGFVFYAREEDNNYTSLNGSLNAWYFISPRLSFRVRDYLIRSDEIREADFSANAIEGQTLLSRTTQRVPYYRNVFEPSVDYRFGRENVFGINYRNNAYRIKSRTLEDSTENTINPRLTYWFNIRNGLTLDYAFTLGEFERSPDFVGHTVSGRYTYRFNPRTSLFSEYTYLLRDFDPPSIDYDIHRPSVGVEHAFSPTLSGSAQAGYYWQNPERGDSTDGFFGSLSLSQRRERSTYTLSLQGGFTEEFFTAENLGFTKYYRAIGRVSHQLLEKMNVGFFGSYEWIKYYREGVEVGRQKDRIWSVGADAAYQPFRWLTLSLEGSRRENHSNFDTADYTEYRGIFRITASF